MMKCYRITQSRGKIKTLSQYKPEGGAMKRKIAAIVEVDDGIAYKKIDDGPVPYLESEFGWLAPSGISLKEEKT